MIKYADDITCSLPVGNIESNTPCTLTEVNNIKRWDRDNQMTLNLGKTKELVIKSKTNKTSLVAVSGIEQISSLKLLGVTVHEKASNWN